MDVVLINKCVYFLSWSVVCLSLSCPWQRSPILCPGAVCLRYRRLPVVPFSLRLHSSCSPQSISVLREADCKVNSLRSWIRWWRLVSTLNGFKRGVQRKWKRSVSCGSDYKLTLPPSPLVMALDLKRYQNHIAWEIRLRPTREL